MVRLSCNKPIKLWGARTGEQISNPNGLRWDSAVVNMRNYCWPSFARRLAQAREIDFLEIGQAWLSYEIQNITVASTESLII